VGFTKLEALFLPNSCGRQKGRLPEQAKIIAQQQDTGIVSNERADFSPVLQRFKRSVGHFFVS